MIKEAMKRLASWPPPLPPLWMYVGWALALVLYAACTVDPAANAHFDRDHDLRDRQVAHARATGGYAVGAAEPLIGYEQGGDLVIVAPLRNEVYRVPLAAGAP